MEEQPEGFEANRKVAHRGGNVASIARKALESETGEPVITAKNAAQLNQVVTDVLVGISNGNEEDNKNF